MPWEVLSAVPVDITRKLIYKPIAVGAHGKQQSTSNEAREVRPPACGMIQNTKSYKGSASNKHKPARGIIYGIERRRAGQFIL